MDETPITLTDKAAEKIKQIRIDENVPADQVLRIKIIGGGCSGFTNDMHFDVPKDGDVRFTVKDVEIAIDQMSLMYLQGTDIDFTDGLGGTGFKLKNPNVKSTCGCGNSSQF